MNNKEKYEGMMVVLNALGNGRSPGEFFVNEVIDDNVLYGHTCLTLNYSLLIICLMGSDY